MLKTGLANPAKVITVLGKDGHFLGKLQVGKTEGNKVNVKLEGAAKIFPDRLFQAGQCSNFTGRHLGPAGTRAGAGRWRPSTQVASAGARC